MIFEIRFKEQLHIFQSDRGDIYYTKQPIFYNSYHVAGKDYLFPKLLEIIEKELFCNNK